MDESRPLPLSPGVRVGPYEILGSLGAGGMGEVFRARDTRLGRDVAVKVLPASFASDAERLHRFEQEARAVAGIYGFTLRERRLQKVADLGSIAPTSPLGAGHWMSLDPEDAPIVLSDQSTYELYALDLEWP